MNANNRGPDCLLEVLPAFSVSVTVASVDARRAATLDVAPGTTLIAVGNLVRRHPLIVTIRSTDRYDTRHPRVSFRDGQLHPLVLIVDLRRPGLRAVESAPPMEGADSITIPDRRVLMVRVRNIHSFYRLFKTSVI